MSVAVAREDPVADRVALARAVLARAEERTGTARWVRPLTPARAPAVHTVAAAPRPTSAPVTASAQGTAAIEPAADARVLSVPPALAGVLPSGVLERGSTVVVRGSTSLTLGLLAEASRTGSWVALVGLPAVGVLAAAQLGLDLDRVVLVPAPGPDGPTVVAALLDGVDVVVVGDVALGDGDRRRLSARARERGAVLLSTAAWQGAHLVLTAEASQWEGLGHGHGRLCSRRMTVGCAGRGAAAQGWRAEVTVPITAAVPAVVAGTSGWESRRAG